MSALFVCIGLVLGGLFLLNALLGSALKYDRRKLAEQSLADLPQGELYDRRTPLASGKGAIALNTSSGSIAVVMPERIVHTFNVSKIIDVGVQTDVKTIYATRGRTTGFAEGNFLLSSTKSRTTSQSKIIGAYLVLSLDDLDYPTLVLPFQTLEEAQHWSGVIRVLIHRRGNAPAESTSPVAAPTLSAPAVESQYNNGRANDTTLRIPSWFCECGKRVSGAFEQCACGRSKSATD